MEKNPLLFLQKHPDWRQVLVVYHTLRQNGYTCFLAGGCVRDALLGQIAKDIDLASDAPPEVVEKLFLQTVSVGKAFGVIRVLLDGAEIEVTRFRKDGIYGADQRRPREVYFSSAEEDAHRRDLTINGLFYDVESQRVIDYVDGIKDLQNQLIRAIGNADDRFQEDALRLLRVIRFAVVLGFQVEKQTFLSVQKNAQSITKISKERITNELEKIVFHSRFLNAWPMIQNSKLLDELFIRHQFVNLQPHIIEKIHTVFDLKDSFELCFIYFMSFATTTEDDFEKVIRDWPLSQNRRKWFYLFFQLKSENFEEILKKDIQLMFHPVMRLKFLIWGDEISRSALPASVQNKVGKVNVKESILQNKEIKNSDPQISEQLQNKIEYWHRLIQYYQQCPKQMIQSGDLSDRFQGKDLGDALKKCFYIQITRQLTNTQEILNEFIHSYKS